VSAVDAATRTTRRPRAGRAVLVVLSLMTAMTNGACTESARQESGVVNDTYTVTIHTGDVDYAGTDANIRLTLFGADCVIAQDTLHGGFEQGDTDTDHLSGANLAGATVTGIEIRHDNTGENPGWWLAHVIVRNDRTGARRTFAFNRWLASDAEPDHAVGYRHDGSGVVPLADRNRGHAARLPLCGMPTTDTATTSSGNGTVFLIGANTQPEESDTFSFVVIVQTASNGKLVCTGSLLSPTVVITAAHCLGGRLQVKIVAGPFKGTVRTVVQSRPYADYQPLPGTQCCAGHDVALLRLGAAMPTITWAGLAIPAGPDGTPTQGDQPLSVSSRVTLVGVPICGNQPAQNRLVSTPNSITGPNPIAVDTPLIYLGARVTCPGDSGLPYLVRTTAGYWTIVGVHNGVSTWNGNVVVTRAHMTNVGANWAVRVMHLWETT
jgi:Trypsin/PLAT/LH2 domain